MTGLLAILLCLGLGEFLGEEAPGTRAQRGCDKEHRAPSIGILKRGATPSEWMDPRPENGKLEA